jgi:N-acetylmuramoyl-L-alanine amidase
MIPQPRSLLLALLVSTIAAPPARAVELSGVRHWSSPEYTRIVIDLSGLAQFRQRTMEDPPRIVVEVEDGRFAFPPDEMTVGEEVIRSIRFNPLKKSRLAQIVIDLAVMRPYDVFLLEAHEDKPARIVVDVKHPAPSRDPGTIAGEPGSSGARAARRIGPESVGDFLVMIDPGHGGEDPGRRNPGGLKEKDLALQFAKDLKRSIDARPGYRAELTRTGDYFVSLGRRRQISEEKGAHLYVSLHFNAAPSRTARGTEIFFVSLEGATDRALKELEDVENSADLVGGLPPTDETTSDDLAKMLVDLRQNDSVERSQRLATVLTDKVDRVKGVETRRVKQAAFAVLKSLFIPAVLVEIGFLSNAEDTRFVRSTENRRRYVDALADGVVAYCEEVEIPRIGWKMHTVAKGETLGSIAARYRMDVAALCVANGIPEGAGTGVKEGRRLRVKGG